MYDPNLILIALSRHFQILCYFKLSTLGFEEAEDVISESSNKFKNNRRGGCGNFEGIVNRTCEFIFAHTKFEFSFFLQGEWLG